MFEPFQDILKSFIRKAKTRLFNITSISFQKCHKLLPKNAILFSCVCVRVCVRVRACVLGIASVTVFHLPPAYAIMVQRTLTFVHR